MICTGRRTSAIRTATLLVLLCASLWALTGCGLAGGTSVVEPSFPVPPGPGAHLAADGLVMEPASARLTAIGAYAWGKFDEDDRATLEEGLRRMVRRINEARPSTQPGHTVHVVLRSYQVAVSNTSGTALACVAWAMSGPDGALLYHEQFYATKSATMSSTVGGLKEDVNEALLRRIGLTSAHLASGRHDGLPLRSEDTYLSFDEVRSELPDRLQSVGMLFGAGHSFVWTASGGVSWDFSRHPEGVDWPAHLASRPRR